MALAAVPAPALVIGEALIDVLVEPGGRRREVPGGSPANVALGLGRLGHPVRFATRIGRDRYGDLLLRHLRESGVELTPGSVDGGPTSTATALLDSRGAATYDFDITWAPAPEAVGAVLTGAPAHVHTGSIATALTPGADTVLAAVETARAAATVSYDPNLRPALLGPPERERDRVERLVAASDVVKASDEDLAWLYPGRDAAEVASRWAEGGGPALVVLTFGARGARAWWRHGSHAVAAAPVRVVDTVGAGDAFTSALVGGLLRAGLLGGAPDFRAALRTATSGDRLPPAVTETLTLASRAAALTCAREGANPPTPADLAP
ncbi:MULTISPECIES: carbohydrate kinase family protein [unclassified Streptomyces]|uniref:carbohydrate kinase family protein n=1 Tax=unclassified Streptomyces TaxID=2593676 RepID=UPI002E2AA5E6|nr:carbohydrate kinase [Streptomyces sp. NBC_00223]